jgi:hypothetical protein
MCDDPAHQLTETTVEEAHRGTSRRSLLKGALAAGGAAVAASVLGQAQLAAARADTTPSPTTGDRIVALGLDGGPRVNDVPAPVAGRSPRSH